MKATFNNTVLAESDDVVVLDGCCYFPPDTVRYEYLAKVNHSTFCPSKGRAHYFDVVVGTEKCSAAAFVYHARTAEALRIKDRIAFWVTQHPQIRVE